MDSNDFKADVVACLDIGSVAKGNIGWAIIFDGKECVDEDLEEFTDTLGTHLAQHRSVSLGFECPLYAPRRDEPLEMARQRVGEGRFTWSAGAGAAVLVTGIAQVNWVLTRLAKRTADLSATTRWEEFRERQHRLFVWEAFISNHPGIDCIQPYPEKSSSHEKDALCGARAFARRMAAGDMTSDVPGTEAISLIGLHLLQTGLNSDIALLSEACMVVKARKPSV